MSAPPIKSLNMNKYIKITKTDALSFLLFVIPIILTGMGLIPFIFGETTFNRSFGRTGTLTTDSSKDFFLMALLSTPAVIILYLRRLHFINRIVDSNNCIPGKVADVQFTKDRGYVTYEYAVKNQTYRTTNRIMKSATTQALSVGSLITVCYNTKNPKQAFIKEIY